MKRPKIAVIGAGSFFFGRPVIWNMVQSEILREGTLALVDTEPKVLKTMLELGKKAIAATGTPTELVGSTDRRDVLKDADFVIYTFSRKNAFYRGLDCEISLKYGVRMCSGDTIGPGGIFRGLREVPLALEIAKDVEELAPDAWVINFVNPATVLGMALRRYAPNIRSFAICDGLHEPYYRLKLLKKVGIVDDSVTVIPPEVEQKLVFHNMGVNHFTWLVRFAYDGKDMMPALRESVAEDARLEQNPDNLDDNNSAKTAHNFAYSLELMDLFKAYPNRPGHTKEYVPYFQGKGTVSGDLPEIPIFNREERIKGMNESWSKNEDYASGSLPIEDFLASGEGDHATDIIESMWGGMHKSFYLNVPNSGAVSNMRDSDYLELLCDLDMSGARPQAVGEMPRGLLGLQHQVLDTHELTAEAAVTCCRDTLLQAMMVDPIVNDIDDGKKIMEELLDAEKETLPEEWWK
ncbi:MAG: family 4 glycosyl hydrolase [Planctomycetota bacterium]|jgi:alpha-galactosidase